jgi:serine/threonine-protein kinase ULK/ATG1
VEAAGKVSHVNVVQTEKVLKTSNNYYFMMEHCEGGELQKWAQARNLSAMEITEIFAGIAEGLQAISQAGITHRDLKTANIFMKNGIPKIGDFGFCDHLHGPKAKRFYNVGSPAFMSPEAYFDTKYSSKSDVWALGVVLFELITKRALLGGDYNMGLKGYKSQVAAVQTTPLLK